MCGVVLVDKKGNALRNCITYLDTRCSEEIDELRTREAEITEIAYNPISNLLSAPKLIWLKNKSKSEWKAAYKWLLPKDYIRLKLTGSFGTDQTDASASMFMDFHSKEWHPIIEYFGLELEKFPEINRSHEVVGSVCRKVAEETGLPEGIPVVAGGADMACTALGTRAIAEGKLSLTIGTAGHVIAPIVKPDHGYANKVYQFCHAIPDMYYAFGAVYAGGLSLAWFKDILKTYSAESISEQHLYDIINKSASEAPIGSAGLYFLPFLTGSGVPYQDPKAKGCFVGLSIRHKNGELLRAIMEGVAYNFRQIVDTLETAGIPVQEIYLGEGGSKSLVWSSIVSSIVNREKVRVMYDKDSAPLGAAILAGLGIGIYRDWAEAVTNITRVEDMEIKADMVSKYEERYAVYSQIYPSLRDVFGIIHETEEK